MEKHPLRIKLFLVIMVSSILALPIFISSFGFTKAPLLVLRGNFHFDRGEEILATHMYSRAPGALQDKSLKSFIDYNLGNVYLSLGEMGPGIDTLRKGLEGVHKDLLFRSYFNLGVGYHDLGQFTDAAAMFIRALKLKPNDWDAKINLELSLMNMRAGRPKKQKKVEEEDAKKKQSREEALNLLETVHRKEEPVWDISTPGDKDVRDW